MAEEEPPRTEPPVLLELRTLELLLPVLRTLELELPVLLELRTLELEELPLLRTLELVLPELLTLELLLELERVVELVEPLERVVLPLERVVLPLERVVLPVERLVFCWLERTAEEELRVLVVELLPELRTDEVLLPEDRTVEVLPLERVVELPEVERVEVPPLVERVWATISGAVSMDSAKTRDAAIVINLLIASQM